MEQSRRAVESYWRSRLIDGATSDEDKVTPVYKLEEICELLGSSHVSIVKEISEFILKRLQHKSPLVKQKALRVIKYAVGKSGSEFRRDMQRNSVAIRQLIHYRGQPDPLKGEALNKAVRETAQEALSALFSSDESKPAPKESSLGSRIQGFGSTNYEMPSDDKKSFISEVVDIGSATIIQGLNNLTQSPSLRKNDTGSYKSPNLRRSLTRENDHSDRYLGIDSHAETQSSSRFSNNAGSGNWGHDVITPQAETSTRDAVSTYGHKTREEKLLETVVTSGGVRLQPTRDALHVFLEEASKLNALSLGHAIETKMKSPMWQVRMKAICVLEAVLRKKDDGHFSVVASYFSDNNDVVVQCSESPQASLREKANKVLSLLGTGQNGTVSPLEKSEKSPQPSTMPDLIDTGGPDDLLAAEDSENAESEPRNTTATASTGPLIDDLFGDSFGGVEGTNTQKLDNDPFADVSFHSIQDKNHSIDLFSGMVGGESVVKEVNIPPHKTESEPFDFFNSSSVVSQEHGNSRKDVNDLMDSLSINGNGKQSGSIAERGSENVGSVSNIYHDNKIPIDILNSGLPSQAAGLNANPMLSSSGAMAYNFPSGLMFNPAFASQQMNYGAMGSIFAQQQQLLATMANFQQLGNLQPNTSINAAEYKGGNSAALPDIFNPGMAMQPPTSLMNDSKREDTKAFDFISVSLSFYLFFF
ncbi:hypothetical protein RD792_017038 [Penstemon davidsonii]|uniref:VHS domain-containing protein n=1 Tax=Penstemon davidsonii TaxID=160366 RepID=A0ABR0CMN8_9LAMI|nr:hypothetical protein RD792_017038 [Penstemon davidsonii]